MLRLRLIATTAVGTTSSLRRAPESWLNNWLRNRKRGCGHREQANDNGLRFCPKHHYCLWPIPRVRPLRFHDLRHTAIHLLFDAGLDVPVVQAFARHRDPKVTVPRYGHLRAEWTLRKIEGVDLFRRDAATPATTLEARDARITGNRNGG